jgi:hypothetical protein
LIKILSLLLISVAGLCATTEKYIGQFKSVTSTQQSITQEYKHYFVFEKQGKKYALPVKFPNKSTAAKILKQGPVPFIVDAQIEKVKLNLDGQYKSFPVLKIKKVEPINLSSLAVQAKDYDPKGIKLNSKVSVLNPKTGGLVTIDGVNDTVTNASIAVGAAALLASFIFDK